VHQQHRVPELMSPTGGTRTVCSPSLALAGTGEMRLGMATSKDADTLNKKYLEKADLVFLGDSIVAGIPPSLHRHYFQNFGVSGACVDDVLSLVRSPKFQADCASRVKVLIMCIGTNNLWKDPVDVVVSTLMSSVELLCNRHCDANVVLLGVLPRGDSDFNRTKKLIADFNRQIKYHCRVSLGELTSRVHFTDIGDKFLDNNGELLGDLFLVDKLHLSSNGYCVFMGEIAPLLDHLMKPHAAAAIQPPAL